MKKYQQLIILIVLFIVPGISAYILYNHPNWIKISTVNKGQLISPAVASNVSLGRKWQLVLWTPARCEKNCLETLDKLARIRLALGRKLYLVDQWLLIESQNFNQALTLPLKNQDIHYFLLNKNNVFAKLYSDKSRVFIIDPNGFMVLSYPIKVPPRDLFNDLERLLKNDEKMR